MPYKKRQHARFPPARIKKIMQLDEEIGKVSAQVPVMVSRALERFLEYIMTSSAEITTSKDAKTLTSHHILQVITNDTRLNFIKDAALKSCASVSTNNGTYSSNNESSGACNSSSSSKKSVNNKLNMENSKKSEENDDDDDEEDDDDDDDDYD